MALAKVLVGDGRTEEALALVEGLSEGDLEVRHVRALAASGGLIPVGGVTTELASLLDRVKGDDDARTRFWSCWSCWTRTTRLRRSGAAS